MKDTPKDPIVLALSGAVTSILSGLGLLEKWGMTADDVGLVGGGLATIAGVVAAVVHGRRAGAQLETEADAPEDDGGEE
jgi:hypothetical protein